jgi:hypothetical protein
MFGRPKSMAITFQIANESGIAVEYQIGDRTLPLPPDYVRTHTVCRPVDLNFKTPKDNPRAVPKPPSLHPSNGDRFVVVYQDREIRITKR